MLIDVMVFSHAAMIRRGVLMHIDTFVWNLEIPLAGITLLELPST